MVEGVVGAGAGVLGGGETGAGLADGAAAGVGAAAPVVTLEVAAPVVVALEVEPPVAWLVTPGVGSPVVGVITAFGSGAGGAPAGGCVGLVAGASAELEGTVAGMGGAVTGAAAEEKITATSPIVAATAEIPVSARADAAGWWR